MSGLKKYMVHVHVKCHSAIKKNEILSFISMWIELERTIQTKMGQTRKEISQIHEN